MSSGFFIIILNEQRRMLKLNDKETSIEPIKYEHVEINTTMMIEDKENESFKNIKPYENNFGVFPIESCINVQNIIEPTAPIYKGVSDNRFINL